MIYRTFAIIALAAYALSLHATEGEDKVKQAAKALLPYFTAEPPKGLGDLFASSFLKAVDAGQMEKILKAIHTDHGRATEFRLMRMSNPYAGEVEFVFDKGFRIPASLTLDSDAPHKITGILFRGPIKDNDKLEDIIAQLKALPGTVSFTLMRLGDSPDVVWELEGNKPQAVASTFKLVVFATLVDEIAKGKRAWKDVVSVRKEWASLPSGLVQDWPDGSPVTLHTLATLMISRSDNTAADHLIRILGRERIEEMQKTLGVKAPERNEPFLCTAEMFKIKLVLKPEQQKEYAAADSAGRRKMLDSVVKETSLTKPRALGGPQWIHDAEWLFSTADLCRVMDCLRQQPGRAAVNPPVANPLDLLAINTGLSLDKAHWAYIGYKGGAEPGVLNFTLLLKNKANVWYAFSISWNNAEGDVDQAKLIGIAQRLVRLAQQFRPRRHDNRKRRKWRYIFCR